MPNGATCTSLCITNLIRYFMRKIFFAEDPVLQLFISFSQSLWKLGINTESLEHEEYSFFYNWKNLQIPNTYNDNDLSNLLQTVFIFIKERIMLLKLFNIRLFSSLKMHQDAPTFLEKNNILKNYIFELTFRSPIVTKVKLLLTHIKNWIKMLKEAIKQLL